MVRRCEARGRLFSKIQHAVRSVENCSAFSRPFGPAEFKAKVEWRMPLRNFGLAAKWEERERESSRNFQPDSVIPFANSDHPEAMEDSEIRRCSSRKHVHLEEDTYEICGSRKWHKRNAGQKPRRSTRESIRAIRKSGEHLLAGGALESKLAKHGLRRRLRKEMRNAEVIQIPDHVWDRWLGREAA